MKITKEWLFRNRTRKGSWTQVQLRALGLLYPPRKGWIDYCIGLEISEEARIAFEAYCGADRNSPVWVDAKEKLRIKREENKEARKLEKKRRRAAARAARSAVKYKSASPAPTYKQRAIEFYASDEWRKLRYRALQVCGAKCQCCGASGRDGATMHVDHVKPRYKFPELELELTNLQVLCADCNIGKGAWDKTDWRTDADREALEHMKSIREE